jgi:hypothetical protein
MSEILNLVEQAAQAQQETGLSFEDARNIAGWAVISALPVAAVTSMYDYVRTPNSAIEGVKAPNDDLLPDAAKMNKGKFINRIKRWTPPLVGALGLSLLGAQMLDPQETTSYEVDEVQTNQVVNVIDASTTMIHTQVDEDGTTRFDLVEGIVRDTALTLPEGVEMGNVLFGKNVLTADPLTTDTQELTDPLDVSGIDSNGGSLKEAITLADSLLGGSSSIGNESLVLFTDGTVEMPNEAANTLERIADSGKQVTLVLTGPSNASYTLDYSVEPIDSSVQAGPFAALDDNENITVIETDGTVQATSAIASTVTTTKTVYEQEPVEIFGQLGMPLILAAGLVWLRRTRNRA